MPTKLTISSNGAGEPRVTFVVEGDYEVFRQAYYLACGPVENVALAQRIFRHLHRRWGHRRFVEHDKQFTDGKVVKHGLHRKVVKDL